MSLPAASGSFSKIPFTISFIFCGGGIASPLSLSASTRIVSPGLKSNISRASFGITNCPRSPIYTDQSPLSFVFIYIPVSYEADPG